MRALLRGAVALCLTPAWLHGAAAPERTYEIRGRVIPRGYASVQLSATGATFTQSALADPAGSFRFKRLPAGTYMLSAYARRGEVVRTAEVSPSLADKKGRVEVILRLQPPDKDALARRFTVSNRQLSIPDGARKEYRKAIDKLRDRDAAGAVKHLEQAVEIAPQFAEAWNHLGTLAYFQKDYEKAVNCFQEALERNPDGFEPLVNLGGVLLNLNRVDEAWTLNSRAVLRRPKDALANAQLGITYLRMGKPADAKGYLIAAKRIDPAHFTNPQLLLASIYLDEGNGQAAAAELTEHLRYKPDTPAAQKIREAIGKLRRTTAANP